MPSTDACRELRTVGEKYCCSLSIQSLHRKEPPHPSGAQGGIADHQQEGLRRIRLAFGLPRGEGLGVALCRPRRHLPRLHSFFCLAFLFPPMSSCVLYRCDHPANQDSTATTTTTCQVFNADCINCRVCWARWSCRVLQVVLCGVRYFFEFPLLPS